MKKQFLLLSVFVFALSSSASIVTEGSEDMMFGDQLTFGGGEFSPYVQFGPIERLDSSSGSYPGRSVGKLIGTNGGHCTATLIANQYILTAGHCFFSTDGPQVKFRGGDFVFYHSFHEGKYRDSAYVTEIWRDPQFLNAGSDLYDWAVAKLAKPLGRSIGYLGTMSDTQKAQFNDSEISLIGYGTEFKKGQTQTKHVNCKIFKNYSLSNAFFHDCDTSGGDSGAPVLKLVDGKYYVIGVHTGGGKASDGTSHYSAVDESNANFATYNDNLFDAVQKAQQSTLVNGFKLKPKEEDANYYTFYMINKCKKKVSLAINSFNLKTNKWELYYWYNIKPGQGTYLNAGDSKLLKSQTKYFYYYAKSGSDLWSGDNIPGSVTKKADNSYISLRKQEIHRDRWGSFSMDFQCRK